MVRRSLLFIPSNSPAMLQNADVFGVDSVIFDLEDSINEQEKDAARILLSHYLELFPFVENFEIIVRINAFDFPLLLNADLKTLPLNKISTIMLPKASLKNVVELTKILRTLEKTFNLQKELKIIPLIELASALIEVYEIAALPRVSGLLLGAEDLATDLKVKRTKKGDEILLARSMVVLAARANDIDAIDTPFTDINDLKGLKEDSLLAKSLGMNAKAAIHPSQIETINNSFSPSDAEIKEALTILELAEKAKKAGKGAFSYQNKMVDKPILKRAENLVLMAQKWNLEPKNEK